MDPAQPCHQCQWCQRGDPNLCPHVKFLGLFPHDGALCQQVVVPEDTCFALPEGMDAITGVMLEPLGVAIHALNLAKLRLGESAAVFGCGPIGLCLLQLLALQKQSPTFAADILPWRAAMAGRWTDPQLVAESESKLLPVIARHTQGMGVDVAFEVAGDPAALHAAAESLAPGGRLIVIGIDEHDRFSLSHATARRKGLTIKMVRRMKHTYPVAIQLAQRQQVALRDLTTHIYPMPEAPRAFAENDRYLPGMVKAIITV